MALRYYVWIVTQGFKTKEIKTTTKKKILSQDKAHNNKKTVVKGKNLAANTVSKSTGTPKIKEKTVNHNEDNINETKIINKKEYVIKRTKKWVILPWADWHEYFINPLIDRRFLKTDDAQARFNTISDILEIWTFNAHKVAENDAFFNSTKKAINNTANNITKKLNNATNDIFEDKEKYKKFINEIFKEIIKTEDNENIKYKF